jgi:hypothetical protein
VYATSFKNLSIKYKLRTQHSPTFIPTVFGDYIHQIALGFTSLNLYWRQYPSHTGSSPHQWQLIANGSPVATFNHTPGAVCEFGYLVNSATNSILCSYNGSIFYNYSATIPPTDYCMFVVEERINEPVYGIYVDDFEFKVFE